MIVKVKTASTIGLLTKQVECEIDLTPSLPSIVIVGLPDKAVQESKERIRSSIKESGYEFPLGKITINLAPADVLKSGTSLDLPLAIGILNLTGFIAKKIPENYLFAGELSLDGKLRPITGCLPICLWASKHGYTKVFVPVGNTTEASLVKNIDVYGIEKLSDLVDFLNEKKHLEPIKPIDFASLQVQKNTDSNELLPNDLAYVRGQTVAKRVLEIAASGGHNILFIGQPGSGKTLLARAYQTILPKMTEEEILEVTQIYSVAGMLRDSQVVLDRPFRAPHHSCSNIALVGGGNKLRPGEISLSHRGVLFLDEFPEFNREAIEALRQPLEDGRVTISRASGSVEYPSRFYLICAANPTPSGFEAGDPNSTVRSQNQQTINRYKAKFSGPILDRIDLQVEVNRPDKAELQSEKLGESSKVVANRVQKARDIQNERFKDLPIFANSEMTLAMVEKFCPLDSACKQLLDTAIDKFKLSPRSYIKIIKLSRTIADLAGSQNITISHLAESLQYRGRWLE